MFKAAMLLRRGATRLERRRAPRLRRRGRRRRLLVGVGVGRWRLRRSECLRETAGERSCEKSLHVMGGFKETLSLPRARLFASAQETVAKDGTPFLGVFYFRARTSSSETLCTLL